MQGLRIIRGTEAGFSLLEVLVVVGIMSVAAYVAIDAVDRDTSQMRYELTETRLATIRRAIVGDPSLTVNGAPMISGYVADVGQLPPCLEALFQAEAECDGNAGSEIEAPAYAAQAGGLIAFGWRGPYIAGTIDSFADAWGNAVEPDDLSGSPLIETGWRYAASNVSSTPATVFDTVSVTSIGRDRSTDAATNIYDSDQTMTQVSENDFRVLLDGWSVEVTIVNVDLVADATAVYCVAFLGPDPTDAKDWRTVYADVTTGPIGPGDTGQINLSVPSSTYEVMGRRVVVVLELTTSSSLSDCETTGEGVAALPGTVIAQENVLLAPRVTPTDVALSLFVDPTP